MQFYDFKEIEERVILIGVQTEQDEDVAASLDELEELAATAGAVTAVSYTHLTLPTNREV